MSPEEAEARFSEKILSGWKPPKVKVICSVCHKLRIVQPLYPTTKAERDAIKIGYVCSDHPQKETSR